jgi:hypothetical protein
MVLNERQAGAAIEGVVRDERWETSQLAVDTHGYTDVAMALARGVGLDPAKAARKPFAASGCACSTAARPSMP